MVLATASPGSKGICVCAQLHLLGLRGVCVKLHLLSLKGVCVCVCVCVI